MRLFSCLRVRKRRSCSATIVALISLILIAWTCLLAFHRSPEEDFDNILPNRQENLVADVRNPSVEESKNIDTKKLLPPADVFLDSHDTAPVSNSRLPKQVQEELKLKQLPVEPIAVQEASAKVASSASQKPLNSTVNITLKTLVDPEVSINAIPSQKGPSSLILLHQKLLKLNAEERVLNEDKFPPLADDSLVIVVQVHKRERYLQQLINSLREAVGISEVLLVISHDYYYDDMNAIVQSVDFCRVIQIFYPYSLQVFPDSFPGSSSDDCPRDIKKEAAIEKNCTNALHPDSFGHYREARVTAIKHHWWWKANTVFDKLNATQHFNGYVIFLEEDHYVSHDFLHTARLVTQLKKQSCADCDFINLGMYTKVKTYNNVAHRVNVGFWNAGKNNMGFGMDRAEWNVIKTCREEFCTYDDYNWDWSLNSLGKSCLQRNLKVMVVKAPRILHIGSCGTHHHKSCNEQQQAEVARAQLDSHKDHLFPAALTLDSAVYPPTPRKGMKNYGGWGDVRDHKLCLSFVSS